MGGSPGFYLLTSCPPTHDRVHQASRCCCPGNDLMARSHFWVLSQRMPNVRGHLCVRSFVYVRGSLGVRREICQHIWTLSIFKKQNHYTMHTLAQYATVWPSLTFKTNAQRIRNEWLASIVANDSVCIAFIRRRLRVRNSTLSYAQNLKEFRDPQHSSAYPTNL